VRSETLLVNHRLAHGLRVAASRYILPGLKGVWSVQQETDSFDPEACDATSTLFWNRPDAGTIPHFTGNFAQRGLVLRLAAISLRVFSKNVDSIAMRLAYRVVQDLGMQTKCVAQFDSWRFWKAFLRDAWRFMWTLMHIHVVFRSAGELEALCRVRFQASFPGYTAPQRVQIRREDIAASGREWALKHYSPRAVAERFLELLQARAG